VVFKNPLETEGFLVFHVIAKGDNNKVLSFMWLLHEFQIKAHGKSIVQISNLYGLKETINHYILAKFEVKRDNFSKVISKWSCLCPCWGAQRRWTKHQSSKYSIVFVISNPNAAISKKHFWSFQSLKLLKIWVVFAISGFISYSVTAGVTQLLMLKLKTQNI